MRSYAGLFRAAFDVYETLHWPKPASPAEEMAHGQQLVMFLTDHVLPESLAYTDAESDKAEPAKAIHPTSIWDCIFGPHRRR